MAQGSNKKPVVSVTSLSSEQRKEVKRIIGLLDDSMTRVAAEKELQKEEIDALCQKYGTDKKVIRRMAKAQFKLSFEEESQADEEFKEGYSLVLKVN